MAINHRKLFPSPTGSNQTGDCSGFCDPACPYNCYPYGDYYYLPPPPPPSPISLAPREHHLSPFVIVLISVLASFFLVVSYYVIIAKSCPGWCSPRNIRQTQSSSNNSDEDYLDENQVDHPIWFITTAGLQQSIINSITICKYKKGEGLIEGTECSVCLSEFQQDETLRLLPKCNHAFHISCIDIWLRSHTNCPMCRSHIVNDPVTNIPPVLANQNSDNSSTIGRTHMENSEINSQELSNFQERNENRPSGDEERERILKEGTNSENIEIICGSGNDHQIEERRPVSTDSITTVTRSTSSDENSERNHSGIFSEQEGENSSSSKESGSSSISQCLHKSPVPMKRSFSCSGRFFSSRQNKSLNSILPL